MSCPYCASAIDDSALVCPVCRRELYLVRQLSERIAELEAELAQRPAPASEDATAPAELPAPEVIAAAPEVLAPWWQALAYWLTPLLLLLLAHWLIVFVYDARLIYLRLLALALPLPFGYLLARARPGRLVSNLLLVVAMAVGAVFAMSGITAWLDGVPVLPQNWVEVREFIEFAASIGFSGLTGLWVQDWLRRRVLRKQWLAAQRAAAQKRFGVLGAVNSQQMADSLTRLNDIGSAVIGVATSAVSIYTGLKGFLGN